MAQDECSGNSMAGIGLQIYFGDENSRLELVQRAHANDDLSREQELFELCLERELISDSVESAKSPAD